MNDDAEVKVVRASVVITDADRDLMTKLAVINGDKLVRTIEMEQQTQIETLYKQLAEVVNNQEGPTNCADVVGAAFRLIFDACGLLAADAINSDMIPDEPEQDFLKHYMIYKEACAHAMSTIYTDYNDRAETGEGETLQ